MLSACSTWLSGKCQYSHCNSAALSVLLLHLLFTHVVIQGIPGDEGPYGERGIPGDRVSIFV